MFQRVTRPALGQALGLLLTKRCLMGIVATITLALLQTDARAAVVYDNGIYATNFNTTSITGAISADDFTFADTASFDTIRFWAADAPAGLATEFSGTLTWAVRANSGGIPGAIIESGTTSDVTVTDTGDILNGNPNFEIAQFNFSVPEVTLDAGTYWLSLKENGPDDPGDGSIVGWLFTASQTGNTHKQDSEETNPTTWDDDGAAADTAFELRSDARVVVPEANTFALALPALGMVGAVVIRRRKK